MMKKWNYLLLLLLKVGSSSPFMSFWIVLFYFNLYLQFILELNADLVGSLLFFLILLHLLNSAHFNSLANKRVKQTLGWRVLYEFIRSVRRLP